MNGRIVLITLCLLCISVVGSGSAEWSGIDETIVEKIAAEHGRKATEPVINTDKGDLLLSVFYFAPFIAVFVSILYLVIKCAKMTTVRCFNHIGGDKKIFTKAAHFIFVCHYRSHL